MPMAYHDYHGKPITYFIVYDFVRCKTRNNTEIQKLTIIMVSIYPSIWFIRGNSCIICCQLPKHKDLNMLKFTHIYILELHAASAALQSQLLRRGLLCFAQLFASLRSALLLCFAQLFLPCFAQLILLIFNYLITFNYFFIF